MSGRERSHSFSTPARTNVPRPRASSAGALPAARAPLIVAPAIAPPPAVAASSDANRVVAGTFLTHHGQAVAPVAARAGRARAMSVRRLTDAELVEVANPLHPKGNSLTATERALAARETQHRAEALLIGAAIHSPPGGVHHSHGPAHPPHVHGSSAVAAPDAAMIRMGRFGQSFVDEAFRGNPAGGVPAVVPSAMKQMGVARTTAGGVASYGVGTSGSPGSPDGLVINGRLTAALAADSGVAGYPGAPAMTVLGAVDPSPGITPVAGRAAIAAQPAIPAVASTPYNAATGQAFVRGAAAVPPVLAQPAVAAVAERKACAALTAGFAANVVPAAGGARVDPRAAAVAATPLTPEVGTQGHMLYEAILNPTGAPPVPVVGVAPAGLPPPAAVAAGVAVPPVRLNSGLPVLADNYTTIARGHPSTIAAATAEAAAAAPQPGTRPRSQSLSAMTESCRDCLIGVNR